MRHPCRNIWLSPAAMCRHCRNIGMSMEEYLAVPTGLTGCPRRNNWMLPLTQDTELSPQQCSRSIIIFFGSGLDSRNTVVSPQEYPVCEKGSCCNWNWSSTMAQLLPRCLPPPCPSQFQHFFVPTLPQTHPPLLSPPPTNSTKFKLIRRVHEVLRCTVLDWTVPTLFSSHLIVLWPIHRL